MFDYNLCGQEFQGKIMHLMLYIYITEEIMRLFTAVIFDDEIKDSLCGVMDKLRSLTDKGSFTLRENLHLTLNFIGETDKLKLAKEAMKKAVSALNAKAFDLTFTGFGRFKRREGDLCWIGVEKEEQLFKIQKELAVRLKDAGFILEDREYTPHLTLARRVGFNEKFSEKDFMAEIPILRQHVRKISLMNSERIDGKLTYTEVFYVDLH